MIPNSPDNSGKGFNDFISIIKITIFITLYIHNWGKRKSKKYCYHVIIWLYNFPPQNIKTWSNSLRDKWICNRLDNLIFLPKALNTIEIPTTKKVLEFSLKLLSPMISTNKKRWLGFCACHRHYSVRFTK